MKDLNNSAQHHCLKLQTCGIIRFVPYSEIVYLKADDNYTYVVMSNLSRYTICRTLQNFETLLGHLFFRCHKTYLVNSEYIREINKRSHYILLNTGESIPYSRNKTKILEEKMKIQTSLNDKF